MVVVASRNQNKPWEYVSMSSKRILALLVVIPFLGCASLAGDLSKWSRAVGDFSQGTVMGTAANTCASVMEGIHQDPRFCDPLNDVGTIMRGTSNLLGNVASTVGMLRIAAVELWNLIPGVGGDNNGGQASVRSY